MMQGKKVLLLMFPLLLLGIFLYLSVREGVFAMPTSSGESDEISSEAVTTKQEDEPSVSFVEEASDTAWQVSTSYFTVGTAEEADKPFSTVPATEDTPLFTTELSVQAMAPVEDKDNFVVTEFSDAWQITTPDTTGKAPTLVTGFANTLPLVLPLASPVEEEDMRAVYVASVYCLDFPSASGLSAPMLRAELDAIVENCVAHGLNTVFFQVRPASDALYRSSVFPTSRFLLGKEGGELPLDPLAYLVTAAHDAGLALHAWINPFRVTLAGEGISSLSRQNPARLDPSLTFTVSGQVYYNPAVEAVSELIVDGVAELCARYDIDGILFDDYFYPADVGTADKVQYEAYLASGGRLSLGDFRRSCVNRVVERVFRAVKALRPDCLFGISPRGIWRNAADDPAGSDTLGGAAYDEIYCDALAWVRGGYIDYLSPQIYWSFDSAAAPFGTLADWWNTALEGSGIALCVSLAAYYLPSDEISSQIAYLEALSEYGGYALYRYHSVV